MAASTRTHRLPLALATGWLTTASISTLAVPVLLLAVPQWHEVRQYLAQLSLWQTWISIAACVGLLSLSRQKHSENEEGWAQGALLIYVLGGMLTAILLHYGVLSQWLARPASLRTAAQALGLVLLHWGCALAAWRGVYRYRTHGPSA